MSESQHIIHQTPKISKFCIICEKPLKRADAVWFRQPDLTDEYSSELRDPPAFAIQIQDCGNFGSQILDCDETIHFCICDVCLTEKADKGLVYSTDRYIGDGAFMDKENRDPNIDFFKVHEQSPSRKGMVERRIGKVCVAGDIAYDMTGNPIGVIGNG